ncbi:hypothetical protein HJG60_008248 [Phyllostomus discolor]|uniref:Uncharacterized protein n=1 Tax=Phyllostomus discolor TaxID=89673 RepID=A0A833Z8G2_9CHIR|nr:hypothetical protein HJG60_008248 [Phyllostomus discolor]
MHYLWSKLVKVTFPLGVWSGDYEQFLEEGWTRGQEEKVHGMMPACPEPDVAPGWEDGDCRPQRLGISLTRLPSSVFPIKVSSWLLRIYVIMFMVPQGSPGKSLTLRFLITFANSLFPVKCHVTVFWVRT